MFLHSYSDSSMSISKLILMIEWLVDKLIDSQETDFWGDRSPLFSTMVLDENFIFCSKHRESPQLELQIPSSFFCLSPWLKPCTTAWDWVRWQSPVFSLFLTSSAYKQVEPGAKEAPVSQNGASGVEPQSYVEWLDGTSETQFSLPQLPRIQLLQLRPEYDWKMLTVCFSRVKSDTDRDWW